MPDPYERHARTKDPSGSDGNPGRRQSRAAAAAEDQAKRAPAKKDPSLCKVTHWKSPHEPAFQVRSYPWRKKPCCWRLSWVDEVPEWGCWHQEACTGCGKVLRVSIPAKECPDFHPITEAEQAALAAEIERWRLRRAARVTPPKQRTGYRKRKGDS